MAIGFAALFVGHDEAQGALISQLATILGEKPARSIEGLLQLASTPSEGIVPALVGLGTMLLGATTVFAELRADLDRIWGHESKSRGLGKLFRARFSSLLLVMGIGALLLASLFASAFVTAVGGAWFGRSDGVARAIEFGMSIAVTTLLFALIYKLLPSRRIAWGDVWVGAAITSLLFWVGKYLIALYIGHAAVDSRFGAAGALVIVILWVYYSSQVFFLGAEFTKEYAFRHGSKRHEARPEPANEDLVERARRIVEGKDPVVNGRKAA